jgi:predicted RNase H-like HicB family nuclease
MNVTLNMVYWRGEQFWLGKLIDHPEIMSQGETLEDLEENLRDAWWEMLFEDVPPDYQIRDIAL